MSAYNNAAIKVEYDVPALQVVSPQAHHARHSAVQKPYRIDRYSVDEILANKEGAFQVCSAAVQRKCAVIAAVSAIVLFGMTILLSL